MENNLKDIKFIKKVGDRVRYDPASGRFFWTNPASRKNKPGQEAGSVHTNGYYKITIDYQFYYAHRLAFLLMTGEYPPAVDHIDHDKLNNKWGNLRAVTYSQNSRNMKKPVTNKSGTVGVWWSKSQQMWMSSLKSKGVKYWLGRHKTYEQAVAARKQGEIDHNFHPNHGGNYGVT